MFGPGAFRVKSNKVVLVTSNFPPVLGGSGVVYENLARFAGRRIIVVAPKRYYGDGLPLIGWREHDRLAPYPVIRLDLLRTVLREPAGSWQKLGLFAADITIRGRLAAYILWMILTERPSAICVGELIANGWLITFLHNFGLARVLVYVHGEEITTDNPYDKGHDRARRALSAADAIIVVSRFTLDAVRALVGDKADTRLKLIENGVDNTRFKPMPKRQDLLEAYGLDNGFVFVSVCRLLEKKGIDKAIEAFAQIAQTDPSCRYLIVGGGPYETALRNLADRVGVADKVTFTGEVEQEALAAHYALGDVFLMPNRALPNGDTEGFGLVFLEANACGLPVIAGSDGGSTDAVRHGYNGLVVDGQSTADIALAMRRLRNDVELRLRLREGALEQATRAGWTEKVGMFLEIAANG